MKEGSTFSRSVQAPNKTASRAAAGEYLIIAQPNSMAHECFLDWPVSQ
jgi:hypothetical protein